MVRTRRARGTRWAIAAAGLGITYRSQVDHDFEDVPSFGGLGPTLQTVLQATGVLHADLGLDETVPQEVMLSGFGQVTDDLALISNFGWQNWSQFGEYSVALASAPPRSLAVDSGSDDTYHVAVGTHYRLGAPPLLERGFAYDSSALTEDHRGPALPIDQQLRFALGVLYDITDDYRLSFAYEYVDLGSAPINTTRGPLAGTLQGDYRRAPLLTSRHTPENDPTRRRKGAEWNRGSRPELAFANPIDNGLQPLRIEPPSSFGLRALAPSR